MMRAALAIMITTACCQVFAATAKEEYELQERCGKRAEQVFTKEFGGGIVNTENGQATVGYTNHYNRKMNKCFYLLTYTSLDYKVKAKTWSTMVTLFDINEQREYANFFERSSDRLGFVCKVGDRKCQSREEWDLLIRP